MAESPTTIVLNPPEKLVLEVRATGRYRSLSWSRNGIIEGNAGFRVSNENFAHFGEVYVKDNTNMADLGLYEMEVNPNPIYADQTKPPKITFFVILLGIM